MSGTSISRAANGSACGCCSGVRPEPVAAAAVSLLDQCEAFLARVDPHAYASPSRVLHGGTIGKHVRHVLDHYRAIFAAMECGGAVDYDHRERGVPMESQPSEAAAAIAELRSKLLGLPGGGMAAPVRVRIMLAGDGSETELQSTVGRELAFATHHAVHHQAMLGAIAAEFGLDPGMEFGRAPSTVHHDRSSC